MDIRRELAAGRATVPRVGAVVEGSPVGPPWLVLDGTGRELTPVSEYLRDVLLSDASPLTCRSYAYGLLRWFRLLWLLGVAWDEASEAEAALLVAWLRSAVNPQRRRRVSAKPAGAVNLRTRKPSLRPGYAPSTINHALSVVSGFYTFHGHLGRGPKVNPVPVSAERRSALVHRSPLEPVQVVRRARLRQKLPAARPRAVPDRLWDELFDAMSNDRDRALLALFVGSGARAGELLGVRLRDVDWARQLVHVVSKGTGALQPVPASPEAFRFLARYLDRAGVTGPDDLVWRTRRRPTRPLSYSALRRTLQRANEKLGTNWSLHDLRHTAASRMANDPAMTLPEVQTILRHAHLTTTQRYVAVTVEDLTDKLAEHYARPRPRPTYTPGYDPDDVRVVFGG